MLIGLSVLFAAAVVFSFEIHSISLVNRWTLDELYSIWASDPSIGFADVFTHRILTDTPPPFFYSALFWTRHLIGNERAAILLLNLTALAVALIAINIASWRAGLLGWALAAGAAFLLSGPVLRYVPEGRSYFMALSVTFVASWYCALAIEVPDKRPHLLSFGLIGLIGASIHLYAALFCACLGGGLVGVSLLFKRRDLLAPGLVLGISACVITGLFLPLAIGSIDKVRWTALSFQAILSAYWEVRTLTLGSHPAVLLLSVLFAAGLVLPATRPLTVAFALMLFLFFLFPILASLKKPIIGGRYWLIGAPSIIVFVLFMTRAFFVRGADRPGARLYWVGALVGLSFLAVTGVNGFFVARADTAKKEDWSGAAIVAPLLQHCAPGSVHVYTSWGFVPGFAFLAHAPEDLFIAINSPENAWIEAEDSSARFLVGQNMSRGAVTNVCRTISC